MESVNEHHWRVKFSKIFISAKGFRFIEQMKMKKWLNIFLGMSRVFAPKASVGLPAANDIPEFSPPEAEEVCPELVISG